MDEPKNTGKFGKGNKGKPKGAVNKATKELKEMILQALDNQGGVAYLESQAASNPSAFMSLIGKVLPMTILGAGDDGSHKVNISVSFD